MTKIARRLTDLVGSTPLVELSGYSGKHGLEQNVITKLGVFNPAGSVEDKVAPSMIGGAKVRGTLKSDATITESISGNIGIGLAMVATIKGYYLVLIMSEIMSLGRRDPLKVLGTQVALAGGLGGIAAFTIETQELHDSILGSVVLRQFENPASAVAHEWTTGGEVWRDTDDKATVFVAGTGTGGAVYGVAHALRKYSSGIYTVVVELASPPVLAGKEAAPYRTQGIGTNLISKLYDVSVVGEVMGVPDDGAIYTGHELAATEGLLAEISSRAATCAIRQLLLCPGSKSKKTVVLLPDTRERYLPTKLFTFDAYPSD